MRLPSSVRRKFPSPRWALSMEARLRADITDAQEKIMAELDDRIDTLTAKVNDVGTAIQTEIQQLRDAIAAGTPVTADQLAKLDDLASKLTGDASDLGADDPAAPSA